MHRRQFLSSFAVGACAAVPCGAAGAGGAGIAAFVKPLQTLPFDRLAREIASLGFSGIEATVRKGGQVEPERVADDLPRLVEALKKENLVITLMTTNVNRADDPVGVKVLRTGASLGIRRYRMQWYRYEVQKPIPAQLAALRPVVRDLATLNRELGITGLYQNHAGAEYVGASGFDLHELIRDIPPAELGAAFDIRHATVEGGFTWPVRWKLLRPHTGVVYVKDARWNGRRVEDVALGAGQVDPDFFRLMQRDGYAGPLSLHVEYLEQSGPAENLAAFKADLATLRKWLVK